MSDLTSWSTAKHLRKWEKPGDDDSGMMTADESRQELLEFSKDYDRILYSTAFRRLGSVTQVVSAGETALFHNRLTHSLKTAQVGARLANVLLGRRQSRSDLEGIAAGGGIETRVVRAACMAHDLGHPPFGHIAETELQNICSAEPNVIKKKRDDERTNVARQPAITKSYHLTDSFEGNAQSFRIVTKLAFREKSRTRSENRALDLTRGTLAAMIKYPWARKKKPQSLEADLDRKWGYYGTELDIVKWVFDGRLGPYAEEGRKEYRTLEAQVMDWADDISYAVHDVEDFFRAGIIPLNSLREDNEWSDFFDYAWENRLRVQYPGQKPQDFEESAEAVRARLPKSPYEGSREDREGLHEFASTLIKEAIHKTRIVEVGMMRPNEEILRQIDILKQLAWYYVIDRPSLESVQRGQRALIRRLYSALIEWVEESWRGPTEDNGAKRRAELPKRLLEYLDVAFAENSSNGRKPGENQCISRAVIDYIVSLTEPEAMELGARLSGGSAHSMLDTWVRA